MNDDDDDDAAAAFHEGIAEEEQHEGQQELEDEQDGLLAAEPDAAAVELTALAQQQSPYAHSRAPLFYRPEMRCETHRDFVLSLQALMVRPLFI